MKSFYVFLSLLFPVCSLFSQNSLSGTPNVYANLIAQNECENSITVTNADVFVPGMGILLLQSTGAAISLGNNTSYGSIDDLNGCGQYEYNRIIGINGTELILAFTMLHNYDVAHMQVVGFQIYENASIDGPIFSPAFTTTGGIVIIEVENTLTINADINASGQGFEGGTTLAPLDNDCSVFTNANNYAYDANDWRGAPKGKGIAMLSGTATSGRGAPANGGGGGNDHNSGGGGGALLSEGGQGGTNEEPSFFGCNGNFPGLGGNALPNDEALLFMGGGGGSGHANNSALTGGAGGGIIIIKASTIVANGGSIIADGINGQDILGDGGSGGGAGGAVIIVADQVNGELTVSARGGNGGTVDNGDADRCFGPGGGGSGGVFRHNTNLAADLQGGTAGLSINSTDCADGTNGAQNGGAGMSSTLANLAQGEVFAAPMIISISNDTLVCSGELVTLTAAMNSLNASFQWQYFDPDNSNWVDVMETTSTSGSLSNILEVQLTEQLEGLYRLEVTPDNTCFPSFTSSEINLQLVGEIMANPTFDLTANTVNFEANVNSNVNAVEWIFGFDDTSTELNPVYTFAGPGTYSVSLIYENECESETITFDVVIADPIFAGISVSSSMGCVPLTVLFEDQSTGNIVNRNWVFPGGNPANSSAGSPLVVFNEVGTYEVTLTVDNGVNSSSSNITIMALAPPQPAFTISTDGLTIMLDNQSVNASTYTWDFGDDNTSTAESPTHTYTTPGVYEVTLNASNSSCGVALSQSISVFITNTTDLITFTPSLYPNPGKDELFVSNAAGSNLQIWNSNGQLLYRTSIDTDQQLLHLNELPKGLFLLQFEKDGLLYNKRWIKM